MTKAKLEAIRERLYKRVNSDGKYLGYVEDLVCDANALLAEVERLRRERDEARAELDEFTSPHEPLSALLDRAKDTRGKFAPARLDALVEAFDLHLKEYHQ